MSNIDGWKKTEMTINHPKSENAAARTEDATTLRRNTEVQHEHATANKEEAAMQNKHAEAHQKATRESVAPAAATEEPTPIAASGRRSADMTARAAERERATGAWKHVDDLLKRYEREAVLTERAASEARVAIVEEPAKLFRDVVLCLANVFVAHNVDERIVRHASWSLEQVYRHRRMRLQEAHRASVMDTDVGHLEDVARDECATHHEKSYPALADMVIGLGR